MERESFVFYKSFYEASKFLSIEDKGKLFDMICQYGLYGTSTEGDGPSMGMFLLIKPQLDANNKKYMNGCKGGEYGQRGGRPKKNWDNSQKPQTNPKLTPNDNDNDNDNENENDNEKENISLTAKAVRVQNNDTQCDTTSCLSEGVVDSVLGFDDVYRCFYHKNGTKKDEKKSRKLFDSKNFTQQEINDILYDEKIFKFEFKYKIRDPLYRPKFDTYINGFNRDGDKQREDRLYEIAKYHMSHKDDVAKMKERSQELKQTFGESLIKEITHKAGKELSQIKLQLK